MYMDLELCLLTVTFLGLFKVFCMGTPTEASGPGVGLDPRDTMTHSLAQGQHRKGLTARSDDILIHSRTYFQTSLGP